MSTIYLIRHGLTDQTGKTICGWTPGISLNAEGHGQAERLAWKLLGRGITRLYCSPLERALETAAPIAKSLGIKVEVRDALGEVKYGEWSGKKATDLESDPRWKLFHSYRSGTRAPGGDSALEAQARIVGELELLRTRHPGETIAAVCHGDIIRMALAYYAGMAIDLALRIEISPASYSVLALEDSGPRILKINETWE
jgi:broad specificity phosphatase PhoE